MPARIELTPEELNKVIEARQSGKTWLGVQQSTGISRRVAQRVYEQWEKNRSFRELEGVRVRVGEIEFMRHLDELSSWAETLLDYLQVPGLPDINTTADDYLSLMMETYPAGGDTPGTITGDARSKARNARRNRLLLGSLKEHTADTIRWDSMDDWAAARDNCFKVLTRLTNLIEKNVEESGNEFSDFKGWFPAAGSQGSNLELIEAGIVEALWKGITAGNVGAAKQAVYTESAPMYGEKAVKIKIGYTELYKKENGKADLLTGFCQDAIGKLWTNSKVSELRDAVKTMQRVLSEFEVSLDPLVLRPHILKTRCPLCPA